MHLKMNIRKWILLSTILLTAFFASCDRREEELRKEIHRISQAIDQIALKTKTRVREQGIEIERVLKDRKLSDVDISGMDSDYRLYGGIEYAREVDKRSGIIYNTGFITPLTKKIKQRMKRSELLLPVFQKSVKTSKYMASASIDTIDGTVVSYPYANFTALLAPGIDLEKLHWMYLSGPKYNPDKEVIIVEPPFFTLGDQGLILPVNAPVYENGEWIGMHSIDIQIVPIVRDFFKNNQHTVFWMTEETYLLGVTPSAKKVLRAQGFDREMWLQQGDRNLKLDEWLKLSNKESMVLKNLALQFKANKSDRFEIQLFGKRYKVLKQKIPSLKMYILGLIELS